MNVRVLKQHLVKTGDALLDGDFERFLSQFALPLEVTTNRAVLWVEDEDMLEEGFEAFTDMLWHFGVNRIERRAMAVNGITNSSVFGRYASRYMKNDEVIVPLHMAGITLEQHDCRWKTTSLHLQSEDTRWPIMLHKLAPA